MLHCNEILYQTLNSTNLIKTMGCVYSNHNRSTNKSNGSADLSNPNDQIDSVRWTQNNGVATVSNSTPRNRIFDVRWCNGNNNDNKGNEMYKAKIEITDTELILRFKGRSSVIWPLVHLRKYGCKNDIFSFECGRRCSTGQGIYVFKCSNSEQLCQTLSDVINKATISNSAAAINSLANLQNSHLNQFSHPSQFAHSSVNSLGVHEYQNLVSFEGDNNHAGTLPSRSTQFDNFRSHSAMSSDQVNHTYLNSSNNMIGSKSQPNYYTSNPLSYNSGQSDGSKNSLNRHGAKSSRFSGSFDSSTLPHRRSTNYNHEYVNSNIYNNSLDDSCIRRKNSDQRLYENHDINQVNTINAKKLEQIRSKMTVSDDLGTFCYVNLDPESRKERKAKTFGLKTRSSRTTPEPYIQLDLQKKSNESQQSESKITNQEQTDSTKAYESANHATGESSNASSRSNSNDKTNTSKEKENEGSNNVNKNDPTVSYAKIDFARTVALSVSAASHRKL